jgi:hypothetical protein
MNRRWVIAAVLLGACGGRGASGGRDAGAAADGAAGSGGAGSLDATGTDRRSDGAGGGAGASGAGGSAGGGMAADAGGAATDERPAIDASCPSPVVPDLLLLMDASSSMALGLDGSNCNVAAPCATTKWHEAITGVEQIVGLTNGTLEWGLKLFASSSTCTVTPTVEVPVGLGTGPAITAALEGRQPTGNTPTRLAVQAGAAYLATLTDARPKFMVLVTDGAPTCSGDLMSPDDIGRTTVALSDALAAGFPTFVVGVAVDPTETNDAATLAGWGGRARSDSPPYYAASNATEVAAALATIVAVAACP